jgi:hypothetical protein
MSLLTPRQLFALPPLGGYRLTWRRRLNLYRNRIEYLRGRTRLRSYPTRLVIEPVSACNLRCPYCLTGAGEVGRARGSMTLELYRSTAPRRRSTSAIASAAICNASCGTAIWWRTRSGDSGRRRPG